jgi:hypothetical protein
MIIKLTNASPEHEGKAILLNTRHMLSAFETTQEISKKTFVTTTNIYMLTQQSWTVKESVEQIEKLIQKCLGNS